MTAGRAVVLGDIGPWACAGQTGGRVHMRVNEEWGLDRDAIERRLGKGAQGRAPGARRRGVPDVKELLDQYAQELERTEQHDEARRVRGIARRRRAHFLDVGAAARADGPVGVDGVSAPRPSGRRSGWVREEFRRRAPNGPTAIGGRVLGARRLP